MDKKLYQKLITKRDSLFNELLNFKNMINGSFVESSKICGNKKCKCLKGKRHRHVVISRRKNKKTDIVYVSLTKEKKAKDAVNLYSEYSSIIQEIYDINVELFKNDLLFEENNG